MWIIIQLVESPLLSSVRLLIPVTLTLALSEL